MLVKEFKYVPPLSEDQRIFNMLSKKEGYRQHGDKSQSSGKGEGKKKGKVDLDGYDDYDEEDMPVVVDLEEEFVKF